MMEEPARHLLLHGIVVLLVGLLTGIPYGRAILKNANQTLIEAWRVAHASLPMGAILMVVTAVALSVLNITIQLQWFIAVFFILSGYAFVAALTVGPLVGQRGLSPKGPFSAKLVHVGMMIGAITSVMGTVAFLYAAWINL